MDIEKFMRRAIELASENVAKGLGGPFGAVVVRNGEIIGESGNRVTQLNDPTAHAEVSAIRLACERIGSFSLEDCVLFTSCEPCPMCLGAIYWARIPTVYYANDRHDAHRIGFSDQFIYEELEKPMEQRSIRMLQLLPDEARISFDLWEKSTQKIPY
ncbi:nucleoside deaminase [Rhodoflexus caldus]|uniref:nucleoside deaminase n=1 Tax=Rhodoflexus caldus TaxID=2891236 RepID=UPI00202AABF1|nr:nucleoside deaminase [Rhodoflexus caldus]